MKKQGLFLLTSGLIAISTLGIITDIQASNDIQLISPPNEQQYYMMASLPDRKPDALDEIQKKITAKKENLLKKIEELRGTSPITAKSKVQTPNQTKTTTTKTANSKPKEVTKLDSKPKQLYTFTRMLDYSPHPTTETILKNKPVLYNGKYYYFTVTYNEDWKDVVEDSARFNSISFTINVFENDKKVRTLTTPKVQLDSKKTKKGQTIGIAEVSPFKFNIKVSDLTVSKKGITVLEFKLDLIG